MKSFSFFIKESANFDETTLKKHHNKQSNYHYDKAAEHEKSATLNGSSGDWNHLVAANAHKKAMTAHSNVAMRLGAGGYDHERIKYQSNDANDLSKKAEEASLKTK